MRSTRRRSPYHVRSPSRPWFRTQGRSPAYKRSQAAYEASWHGDNCLCIVTNSHYNSGLGYELVGASRLHRPDLRARARG